jgi:predicted metalloprotease with PDZ domain
MTNLIPLLLALAAPPAAAVKPQIGYTLHVSSTDLSGWTVEIRLRTVSDTTRLAMAAHPEYDDRYRRYVTGFEVQQASGTAVVSRPDSAIWQIVAPPGEMVVRYRIALPAGQQGPRGAWRPFLSPTGGLVGGPHAFMYLLGAERLRAPVTLDIPAGWRVATGLGRTSDPLTFTAANAAALMESPLLIGQFRDWQFVEGGVRHRVVYWSLPDGAGFDTSRFVSAIQQVTRRTIALFGRAPYREYTFIIQDGAYGGLEHPNSVTLGIPSAELAKNPYASLPELAHEFFHTWNLMTIRPVEYREIDYRTQAPVSSLWFSEGLTIFYANRLLLRAGLPTRDSTPTARLEDVMRSYLGNPGYARFSAEAVSRVAYNAEPGALGDYGLSTHLQGEAIGTMLDLIIRDATREQRSMDDVMRLLFTRGAPIDSRVIEQAVEDVCGCDVTPFFDAHVRGGSAIDFDRYLALAGQRVQVTWAPAMYQGQPERDLRIFGWEDAQGVVRLTITNPTSVWARAGLHSRDQLERIDGERVTTWPELRAHLVRAQIGDTVRVEVRRADGPFTATVVVSGYDRPVVKLVPLSDSARARSESR